jgi:hypothetical protein
MDCEQRAGSATETSAVQQDQRIKEAADVLRRINPDIVLFQEVRDYDACARLCEAIAPGIYRVAICSAFKEPLQRGLGQSSTSDRRPIETKRTVKEKIFHNFQRSCAYVFLPSGLCSYLPRP